MTPSRSVGEFTGGELIDGVGAPEAQFVYMLSFPGSQVFAVDSSGHTFRVVEVTERLRIYPGARPGYGVGLRGPRQLKKGGDSRVSGYLFLGDHWGTSVVVLPASVRGYLIGEERLRRLEAEKFSSVTVPVSHRTTTLRGNP